MDKKIDKKKLKEEVCASIDMQADKIINLGRKLQSCPELGFMEHKTSDIVTNFFSEYGIEYKSKIAITGVKGVLRGRKEEFNLSFMGELDALFLPSHIKADPVTGAAHACGHHAQITTMLGTALGLNDSGAMKYLDGNVSFFAVPAEEVIDYTFFKALVDRGEIRLASGKQEVIRLGELDNIDAVVITHSGFEGRHYDLNRSWNGMYSMHISFLGKSTHAGLSPSEGINALNAAVAAIVCINSIRETLKEEDYPRIHFVIEKGGDRQNIVPEEVTLALGIRASSRPAMKIIYDKVIRAVKGAAYATGCETQIEKMGGYMPFVPTPFFDDIMAEEAGRILSYESIDKQKKHYCSSTDAGDLSSLVPTIHARAGGFVGKPHMNNYDVDDEYMAYIVPSKVNACMAIEILSDNAKKGKEIKQSFIPRFSGKKEYLSEYITEE